MNLIYREDVEPYGEESDNTDWMNLHPGDLTSTISTFCGGWAEDVDNPDEKMVSVWIGVKDETGNFNIESSADVPDDAAYIIERKVKEEVVNTEFASSEKEAFDIAEKEMKKL